MVEPGSEALRHPHRRHRARKDCHAIFGKIGPENAATNDPHHRGIMGFFGT
jgi:hypothetical protein